MNNYTIIFLFIVFCIFLVFIAKLISMISWYLNFRNKKTIFGKLRVDDVFCLVAIDKTKTNNEIVNTFYVVIEPITIATQFGEVVDYTEYKAMSLYDGQLFDFQDDTIVYYQYNFKSKP